MKNFKISLAVLAMVLCVFMTNVVAAEQLLEAKVSGVTTALDKNGNEYTRLIVDMDRKIQGVNYKVGIPAMAFGSSNADAKKMKAGDNLKAIVNEREYNGRTSFTIIKMLPAGK